MTYADLIAARPISNAADRRGTVIAHAADTSHLFVTQSLLSWDRVAYPSGSLEHAYELKHVGRYQGGHLFRTGFVPQVWSFAGVVFLETQCGSPFSPQDVLTELQLLRQFLRGFTDPPFSDNYPDPRLKLGYLINHRYGQQEMPSYPFAQPYPFAQQYPFATSTQTSNIAMYPGQFIYVNDSFKVEDFSPSSDIVNFSFQLQELPPQHLVVT